MLEQVAHYNDISPELREFVENEIKSFGKRVKFKFNISHPNPDPEKYNGPTIWPFLYTLDPSIFNIVDPYEKRPNKSKSKPIAMVDRVDEKGVPNKFRRIRIYGRDQGIKSFDLENTEDQEQVFYMLLHPKLTGGMFSDKNKQQLFERIDEKKDALEARERRKQKKAASAAVAQMTTKELQEFASAMLWDENDDPEILRDKAEELADTNPDMFKDLTENKSIEFKAVVKRAIDNKIIAYNPMEFKFVWVSNQQTITVLGKGIGETSEVDRLAEWLMTNGEGSEKVYKKIKSLVKS